MIDNIDDPTTASPLVQTSIINPYGCWGRNHGIPKIIGVVFISLFLILSEDDFNNEPG